MRNLISERTVVFLTLMLVSVALFATTFGTEYRLLGAVQSPVFFPRIILGLMIGLAGIAIVQEFLRGKRESTVDRWPQLIVLVIASLIYVNAITRVGFMLASVPLCVVALWVFGIRSPLVLAIYSVAVPGIIVVLFNHVLKLPLPTSPFTYLF